MSKSKQKQVRTPHLGLSTPDRQDKLNASFSPFFYSILTLLLHFEELK